MRVNTSPFKFVCKNAHGFCNSQIKKHRAWGCHGIGGVGVMIFDESGKLLVGKQRGGSSKDTYSIIHGKIDPSDGCCYRDAAIRETLEEFKIDIQGGAFSKHFIKSNNKIRCFILQGTVIFLGFMLNNDINLTQINAEIAECVKDTREETWPLREVEDIRWIDIDNPDVSLSKFTKIILSKMFKQQTKNSKEKPKKEKIE